jgi:hypothetical protein
MKKSYVIVESTWEKDSDWMHCGRPDFVFTSKAKAIEQMETIVYLVSHGRWFMEDKAEGEPSKYYVESHGKGEDWWSDLLYRIVVKRTDLPNRIMVYDLYERVTNSICRP